MQASEILCDETPELNISAGRESAADGLPVGRRIRSSTRLLALAGSARSSTRRRKREITDRLLTIGSGAFS